jgi:HAD superfamily hydrolase (TIGR01549 family)
MGTAFKETLKDEGIAESLDEILKYMKISMSHALQHYEVKYKIDSTIIERFNKKRKVLEVDLCKPYKGIEDICKSIYTSGKNNYLYTHRGESSIMFLKTYHLYDYFTECITSQYGFGRKPSPDAINYLVAKYNIIRKEAIMIGDRDLDIMSAKNSGISSCFFNEAGEKSNIADYSIDNYQQLYIII